MRPGLAAGGAAAPRRGRRGAGSPSSAGRGGRKGRSGPGRGLGRAPARDPRSRPAAAFRSGSASRSAACSPLRRRGLGSGPRAPTESPCLGALPGEQGPRLRSTWECSGCVAQHGALLKGPLLQSGSVLERTGQLQAFHYKAPGCCCWSKPGLARWSSRPVALAVLLGHVFVCHHHASAGHPVTAPAASHSLQCSVAVHLPPCASSRVIAFSSCVLTCVDCSVLFLCSVGVSVTCVLPPVITGSGNPCPPIVIQGPLCQSQLSDVLSANAPSDGELPSLPVKLTKIIFLFPCSVATCHQWL